MTSQKIRIAARLRPRIAGEQEDDAVDVRDEDGSSCVTVAHPRDSGQRFKFRFSSCYGESSTQEELFRNDIQPMMDFVFGGMTVTVFAYGVTSSGKTHTMQGTKTDPGVIPRVVKSLFERTGQMPHNDTSITLSYVEIYKDDVYDLLVDRETAPKLPVRENDSGQVFVANVNRQVISDSDEFEQLFATAMKRRSTGATNLNRASSRSHAILTIEVKVTNCDAGTITTGKVNLVDLAGSENNKLTGNDPSRMAESSAINKSLSVLGQVVHALNQGASRIPYRNSKLTRILQDALGGSAVGLLICNLAPGLKFRQDTWNTLNFATRTKEIENKVQANVKETVAKPYQQSIVAPRIVGMAPNRRVTFGPRLSVAQAGPSRLPAPSRGRLSHIGLGSGPTTFQPFGLPPTEPNQGLPAGAAGLGTLTEEDIDERIAKAVEQEVARRLAERESQSQTRSEGQRQTSPQPQLPPQSSTPPPPMQPEPISSGLLTPLLKRHQDLDNELKRRLLDLENKYDRGNKEMQLADVLSPVSKKRTGRAYVALARAHSEKGDLQVALDLYRKATTYAPDNDKLRERIIEIEYAVKNNVAYISEPRGQKRRKAKGKKRGKKDGHTGGCETDSDHNQTASENNTLGVVDSVEHPVAGQGKNRDGTAQPLGDKKNMLSKRPAELTDDLETPAKRQKKYGKREFDGNDEYWITRAPPRDGRMVPTA
ncbi:kinesin-domain-containing protein [Rickenella mellea]|uniref:Kinesin-like protein n=1 Tax=Rickenella mellea TaxID=50990 RepID=A0A4Y7PW29_9AGAM|nr:kinesin-domain-containing protein [Rickenella mellea]